MFFVWKMLLKWYNVITTKMVLSRKESKAALLLHWEVQAKMKFLELLQCFG